MKLPTVKGSNLKRQKMEFPADFAGAINLVFIAFLRRHQDLIDEWVPFAEQLVQENPDFNYYEFPTLQRKGPIYRTLLNDWTFDNIIDINMCNEIPYSTENTQTGILGELTWGLGHLRYVLQPQVNSRFRRENDLALE